MIGASQDEKKGKKNAPLSRAEKRLPPGNKKKGKEKE